MRGAFLFNRYTAERTLPVSNFLLELAAFAIVFIVCMVLVTAIREDETKLRTTMQVEFAFLMAYPRSLKFTL